MASKQTFPSVIPASLVDCSPTEVLPHGPSKLFVDKYLWHVDLIGCIASYKVRARDVVDHFGLMRGVDQIEFFGQAVPVSGGIFHVTQRKGIPFKETLAQGPFLFLGVGEVRFRASIAEGDVIVALGFETFNRFNQVQVNGRIYKAPPGLALDEYFATFTEERLRSYDLQDDFELATEIFGITGRYVKNKTK